MDMFSGVKKNIIQFYFLKIKPNIKHSLKNKGVIGQKTTILLQFVEGKNRFFLIYNHKAMNWYIYTV